MAIVYSINVGANSSHGSVARSPVFSDDSFVYVSFPTDSVSNTQDYAGPARSFVKNPDSHRTHADPDWARLTYGDYCANPRAGALKNVDPGDILLFWGLLWRNGGDDWAAFTGERDWFIFGALRVAEILGSNESVFALSSEARARALFNVHLDGDEHLREGHRVFVGDLRYSRLLSHAVGLGVSNPDGLLYRAFTAANGTLLSLNGKPAWQSSLRSCRPVWDLGKQESRGRAEMVRRAISARNDFDFLSGVRRG